jgi:hypothetical protein
MGSGVNVDSKNMNGDTVPARAALGAKWLSNRRTQASVRRPFERVHYQPRNENPPECATALLVVPLLSVAWKTNCCVHPPPDARASTPAINSNQRTSNQQQSAAAISRISSNQYQQSAPTISTSNKHQQ